MSMGSQRSREHAERSSTRLRVGLVAFLAALVPIVWCALVLEADADPPIVAAMASTSVVFWSAIAAWLCRARLGWSALPTALGIGALSPVLCAALWAILLLPLWPVLLITSGHALFVPLAIFGVLGIAWPLFVPVGAGMGLAVFLLTLDRRASRAAPA
jgi:hypothetical protein